MKKLIIFIGLISLNLVTVLGQSKKVTELDYDTDVDNADILYSIDDGSTSKQMRMDTLLNTVQDSINGLQSEINDSLAAHITKIAAGSVGWALSGDKIYMTSSDDSIGIGTASPSEHLDLLGDMRIRSDLKLEDTLFIGTATETTRAKIYPSGAYGLTMSLKDVSGTYTLSTLGGAGVTSGSGITIDGSSNVNLTGTLTENADIDADAYNFYVHNNVGGLNNRIYLTGGTLNLDGSAVGIKGVTSWVLYNDSATFGLQSNRVRFTDNRTSSNIRGLEYFADYSAQITAADLRSIADIGTTFGIVRDTLADIFFTGDTIYSGSTNTFYVNDNLLPNALFFYPDDDYIDGTDGSLDFYIGGAKHMEIEADSITFHASLIPAAWDDYLGSAGSHIGRGYIDTIYIDADNDSRITTTGDDSVIVSLGGTTALTMELVGTKIKVTAEDTLTVIGDAILGTPTAHIARIYQDTITIGDSTFTDADFEFGGEASGVDLSGYENLSILYEDGDSISSGANFLYDGDTIKFEGWKIYENATNDLVFNNGTSDMFELDNGGTWSGGTDAGAAVIRGTASASAPTFSWDSDDNTGLVRRAADYIWIQAGGDNTLAITKDSIIANDTIYLDYLTSPTEYGWMVMDSAQKSLFVDSLADAGFGLEDRLLPIDEYLRNIRGGELEWKYGKNKYSYGLKRLKPTEAVTALAWQTEHLLRYTHRLTEQNRALAKEIFDLKQQYSKLDDRIRELENTYSSRNKSYYKRKRY